MPWFGRAPATSPLDILVVCTGNVCRSPYIAAVLGAALPELTIRSAGTDALVGQTPSRDVQRALAERGVRPVVAPAVSLTREMIRGARLIITATRRHRTRVVAMNTDSSARAFTLKELARVTTAKIPPRGFGAVLERAAMMAQIVENVDYDDDLDDPFGLEWPAYERMAREVDSAVGIIVPALRPMTGPSSVADAT